MNAAALVSFLLPVVTGLLLVPAPVATTPAWLGQVLRLAMAFAFGVGLHASGFFLSLILFDGTPGAIALIDGSLLSLAGGWWVANRSRPRRELAVTTTRPPPFQPGLAAFLALLVFVSTLAFILASIEEPHGGWDAWAIWNLRARFLARASTEWPAAFSAYMPHPDYPLLVPGAIARIWSQAPGDSPIVPIALVYSFSLSLIALTCSGLAVLRGSIQALLAGVCLTPVVLNEAAYQYADVHVGLYLLLSLVLLALHDRTGVREMRLIALAGLAAALAAWTKNEGLLFFLAIAAGRLVTRKLDRLWCFLAGAAPVLALLAYFKLTLAPPNDLLPHLEWIRILRPERFRELASAIGTELSGSIGLVAAALLPPLAYALLLGRDPRRELPILPWIVTLGTSVTALLVLYLVAPRQLEWFVANSMDRLALQFYPALLFVTFLFSASPEERLGP